MNRISSVVLVLLSVFCLAACASIQNQADIDKAAGEHDFGYYFTSPRGKLAFDDIDAAYNFLNEATAKFRQAGAKRRAQGLSGIVNDPIVETGENKPAAGYFIRAYGTDGENVIPEGSSPAEMEKILKDSVGAYLGFIVFYEDRAVMISHYYLKDGYVYVDNSQPRYVEFDDRPYEVSYPVGWTMERAFRYLREGK